MSTVANLVPSKLRLWKRAMQDYCTGEPELRILSKICPRDLLALDIGANYGVYSWYLRKYAKNVIAFEPQPHMARFLRSALGPAVQVEQVALSDAAGTVHMRVPVDRMQDGRATIEDANALSELHVVEIPVQTNRLDAYQLGQIGFMKIDVEGHELKVLKGAEAMIRRDLPVLMIEAEDRHRPNAVLSLLEYLVPFGYKGFYLRDGELEALSDTPGPSGGPSSYNFIFSTLQPAN